MHMLNSMRIKAKRDDVLAALHKNRAAHAAIVKEARTGYVAKAKDTLMAKLRKLDQGKIVSLSFSLRVLASLIEKQEEIIRHLHSKIDWAPSLPSYLQKTPPPQEPN
jgi:hypothetical protein